MIRSPLTRRTTLKRESAKRKTGRPDYQQAKAVVFDRDGRRCRNCHTGHQLDAHHIYPQSRYPERRCDPDAMLLLCRTCHTRVHDNPVWAKEHGYLR